jgi:RNase adaptor protein for sRNA GlmZ degradation
MGTAEDELQPPRIVVESFGFLHGVPSTAVGALLVDLRQQLRDPHTDPALRQLTGHDQAVRDKVVSTEGALSIAHFTAGQAQFLLGFNSTQNFQVRVLIGCQGGRHRSVVLAELVGRLLADRGISTSVRHHHVHRPVVAR